MEQKKCKPCTFPVSTINRVETVKVGDYIKKQIWQWSFDKCKCKLWYFVLPILAIFVCCWKGQNRCVNLWSSDRENNSWEKNCRLRIPLWGTKPAQFTVICAHKLFQQLGHSMWSLFCISLSTFYPTELPTDILCNLVDNKWRFSCANYFRQMGHFPFLWFDQISYILNSLLGVFFPYL